MPSFSRNTRAHALIIGFSAALLGTVSHAGDNHFQMTAYSNVVGGQEILSGDYKAALTKLDAKHSVRESDAASIALNRCVALTMAAQWGGAEAACDVAVHYAQLAQTTHQGPSVQERMTQDETIAIAYSDRAVLKWLTGDNAAATQDLERARKLAHGDGLVSQNVTALSAHSTLAEVRSAEQR